MCGFCGELRLDGRTPDLGRVARMLSRLERRGPDHEGSWSDGPIALGHRRLSVIDLSERSHQPMVDSEAGLVLLFNGTIYNFRELRAELVGKGYHFFSDGDSEVILKAYAAWGEQCVEHLHGMFAFAIWHVHDRRLFLARDRFGIKPLYYALDGNSFRFASNTQALLAAGGIDTSIDAVALHHQLTLHAVIPAPRTILNGIRKLAPGHYLTIDVEGNAAEHPYWELYASRPSAPMSEAEWVDAIHAALRRSVRRRLDVADVPVGVLLSGGLDSSLLVALLAEQGVEDILTFSIGFEDVGSEQGSEFEFSDQVVERYRTRHHKYAIPNSEVLRRLPEAVDQMAEPMVGQDAVAFYLLGERVAQEVKVVQSGQGADEVFAGYFWYPQMDAASGTDLERFARHYFDRPHTEFLETVAEPFRGADHTGALVERLLAMPGADTFIDRVLRMDVTTLIVDDPVKRVDNMTMAWGLEARVPFLDQEVVELAMRMPPELKLGSDVHGCTKSAGAWMRGSGGGKQVLKQIARGLVPDAVIDRPKGYFPMPALKYVRGEFYDFMRDILGSQRARERGLFNPAYVAKLLAAPEDEAHFTRLRGSKLWHLALLELWLQRNVDA